MIENDGFSLGELITNQDISLTYTPGTNVYTYEYTVYKDGTVYLTGDVNSNLPVKLNFKDEGTYDVDIVLNTTSGYSKISSDTYVIDKEKPIITVKKEHISLSQGDKFDISSNVTVTDNYNNNLKESITTNYSDLDFETLGVKELVYSVSDEAGNLATKTVYINVVKAEPSITLGILQVGLLLFIILAFISIIRYNRFIKIQNRLSKFSIKPVSREEQSLLSNLTASLDRILKKVSNVLNKFYITRKLAKRYDKYLVFYSGKIESIDIISAKLFFSLLMLIIAIISFIIHFKEIQFYELIVPIIVGYFSLDLFYYIKYKIYRMKIENDLLEAITIMDNAFKSGSSITQAVKLVTTELEGPIGREFEKIYVELSFGLDMNTVFTRFADRINVEEATYLTASLTILNKTGGNIIKIFSAIEKSLFNRKKLKLELKALTSSSKIIKYVLFIVPIAFYILITLVDKTYFDVFFSTTLGMILFGVIILLYISYILVVRRIMKVRM